MWKLLAGMVFSLFPRRWREGLPRADQIPWEAATTLSGMAESIAAVGALLVWYSASVTTWAANAIDSAVSSGKTIDVGETVGFAALVLWVFHPLTWLIVYFIVEGGLRALGAAITSHIMGTFPLYLVDCGYGKLTHRAPQGDAIHSPGAKAYARSFVEALRDEWKVRRLPLVADELTESTHAEEEYLEIRACRPKPEWVPPRVIRVEEQYYRLEASFREATARPYVYRLRKLLAGVPGRTVILYQVSPQIPEPGRPS